MHITVVNSVYFDENIVYTMVTLCVHSYAAN